MGIQGLLPLLKPIQRHRHLSELSGQTVGVDAYVWLHRGAYGCAAELVQGRPTSRYVDFCLSRIRLLRHHGIAPYLVFDGGPLPAKLGTEKERESRREQNLIRAKELERQGKATLARELYVKCVDVTPQMAYQVIKALKSENVPYVVAPYEADAQLAYLERTGVIDGILTEDSDLLVFGCRNVYFKLDTVSASVIGISRADFGSPALAAQSFSLVGWSDVQFRWMAMLSGCDYLPSIAGVGLKTAYQHLKKYRSVEKVVKMIRLEGKKTVPKGYLDAFFLAEKVFLYQRVFDPFTRKLVHLTEPCEAHCLEDEVDMYIGRDLEPPLAIGIAEGNVCPISHSNMDDINPSFLPGIKAKPLRNTNSSKVTGKTKPSPKKHGLMNFFAPVVQPLPVKSKIPNDLPSQKHSQARKNESRVAVGNASGKRTLMDVMDQDIATKRKKVAAEVKAERDRHTISTSRFFVKSEPRHRASSDYILDKENENPFLMAEAETTDDPVTQEDGYLSPSPCLSRCATPDVSSPIRSYGKDERHLHRNMSLDIPERIFVRGSSEPAIDPVEMYVPGPDLSINLAIGDEDRHGDNASQPTSDISCWEEDFGDVERQDSYVGPTPSTSKNFLQRRSIERTPLARTAILEEPIDELHILDDDDDEFWEGGQNAVHTKLAEKWKQAYSHAGSVGGKSANQRSSSKASSSINAGTRDFIRSPSRPCHIVDYVQNHDTRPDSGPRVAESRTCARAISSRLGPKTGSQNSPILVDADDMSDTIMFKLKTRLVVYIWNSYCVNDTRLHLRDTAAVQGTKDVLYEREPANSPAKN